MVADFFTDLNKAKVGEEIVLNTFSALAPEYVFNNVSGDPACYHKGDILATAKDGHKIFIEVKQDGRIAQTQNVLLEDEVDYHNCGRRKGNLHSDYEIYCVVSPQRRKIAVLDFKILKEHYKEGRYCTVPHYDQTTYCYLLPLNRIAELGGVIAVVDYEHLEITYKKEN